MPANTVDAMSLEDKIGQIIIGRLPDWAVLEKHAQAGTIGGITMMLTGLGPQEVVERLNDLQRNAKYPLLIGWGGLCYDGGTDLRVISQPMRLGATRSKELAYLAGRAAAVESRAMGFHLVPVPNLDVNSEPANPIINLRSISDDADLVIDMGTELARGAMDAGGATVAMHFPGHGATVDDSHIRIPVVRRTREQLDSVDLRTFREAAAAGVLKTICTNHCLYPALDDDPKRFATISRRIVTDLLRREMGYDGIIFSDSLTMRAIKTPYGIEQGAALTVAAGHDLILQDYESDPQITFDALVQAVRDGVIPEAQIDASARRVWALKQWLGIAADRFVDPAKIASCVNTPEHQQLARRLAQESVTVIEDSGLPVRASGSMKVTVIANRGQTGVARDMNVRFTPVEERLVDAVRARFPQTQAVIVDNPPTDEQFEAARQAAAASEVVITAMFTGVRAYAQDAVRIPARYGELLGQILGGHKRAALVNFGNPYLSGELPTPAVSMLTFSDVAESIDAAAAVLCGERRATGKMPVRIGRSATVSR